MPWHGRTVAVRVTFLDARNLTIQVADQQRRRRLVLFGVLSVVALVLAVGSLGAWLLPADQTSAALVPLVSVPTTGHDVRFTIERSRPMQLLIPKLGLSTGIILLGLKANGQVMVPTNVRDVGWFREGPTPGEIGSSVFLGHVDSSNGPGVFFRLKTLAPGDLIKVTLADRVKATFKVRSVVQYPKTALPAQLVYGSHGTRSLNLVTCGGIFNHATGSYASNIVVFSTLVSTS